MTPTSFPVPEFDGPTVVFGAPASAYLTREQMGDDFYADRNEFTRHAANLFYSGGTILPAGRRWKEGVDPLKAKRAIQSLLCSFEPKHEVKIGTVGFAFSQWTEVGESPAKPLTPHQAQRKKPKHKGKGRAFGRAA